jgi:hypothetical protein
MRARANLRAAPLPLQISLSSSSSSNLPLLGCRLRYEEFQHKRPPLCRISIIINSSMTATSYVHAVCRILAQEIIFLAACLSPFLSRGSTISVTAAAAVWKTYLDDVRRALHARAGHLA